MENRKADISNFVVLNNIQKPCDLYKLFAYLAGVHAGHVETGREADTRLLVSAIPSNLRLPVLQFIGGLEQITAAVREQSGEKSKD